MDGRAFCLHLQNTELKKAAWRSFWQRAIQREESSLPHPSRPQCPMWILYDTTWQDKTGASRSSTLSVWPGEAGEEMLVTRRSAVKDADGAGTTELTATTASPRPADGTVSESYWAWRAVSKTRVLTDHSLGREQRTQQISLHIMTSNGQ